jgi:hypothetical protein
MAISINQVRNIVMFFISKNNFGYVTPDEFNLYSQMAQMDIFNSMFPDFNDNINLKNKRLTNSEYADIPASYEEAIDFFAVYTTPANFTYDSVKNFWSYTGTDLFLSHNLSLVNAQGKKKKVELVSKSELDYLVNSNMTAPSVTYPVYTKIGDNYRIFPLVPSGYTTELFYTRYPKTPKWTSVDAGGNPVFNASDPNLQDFEIEFSYFADLVIKILKYAGLSIRDSEVMQAANSEELKNLQLQNQ